MLLVLDEIQSGFGRTGRFWGHEHHDVSPDVVITAKGLASGFPLSAFGAPGSLMEKGWPGSQGGTYGGNAVACAAAIATLDVIASDGLVENAATEGARLSAALHDLADRFPVMGDVRGPGLMIGVEFTAPDGSPDGATAAAVLREAAANGLLMLGCGPYGNVVRWVPPLTVTAAEIDEALDIYATSLEKAAS
jgi:4-aminobutyrate aminotransferase